MAAAEAALARFLQFCQEAGEAHRGRLQQQTERTQRAWGLLWTALEDCVLAAGIVGPMVVAGGVVSIVQVYDAGLGSVFDAASVART